jgi:hypothetical protein
MEPFHVAHMMVLGMWLGVVTYDSALSQDNGVVDRGGLQSDLRSVGGAAAAG